MDRTASAPAADGGPRRAAAGGERDAAWDVAIVAAVLAGLLIRVSAAYVKILWFDEFLAGNLVRHSWRTLLPAIRHEAHPPLYYALLKLWCACFGDGASGLKSLSVVAGTAAVALTAAAVREAFGGAAAAAAAVLVAFSTVQIDQGSEAKPYGMLAFFVALLLWTVVRDRRVGSRGSLLALLAAGVACASTHFYGGVAAGGIACAAIVSAPTRKERLRSALLFAAVAAISAVWLAGALHLDRGAADYIRKIWGRVPVWAPLAASSRVSLPGWRKPYPPMKGRILPDVGPREIAGAAIVLGIALGAAFRRRSRERRGRPADRRFLVWAALALWPGFLALEVALAAVDRPVALVGRSEVVAEIGLAVFVAAAVSRWRRGYLPIPALLAVGLWTVVPQWRPGPGPRGRRWEEVIVRRLQAVVPPGAHVDIVTLGLGRPPFDYYADGDPRLRFISFPKSQNSHPGWAAHSVSAPEIASLPFEAERLITFLDRELDHGVPVYLVERGDPRNEWLLSALRRDHEVEPVPGAAKWFKRIVRSPRLTAARRERFSLPRGAVLHGTPLRADHFSIEMFSFRPLLATAIMMPRPIAMTTPIAVHPAPMR